MADFLSSCIDDTTGLPKPSYDLWEERFNISTYTAATVYASCYQQRLWPSSIDDESAVRWRASADDMQLMLKSICNAEKECFLVD